MARLLDQYKQEIAPQLGAELGRTNPMAVPRLQKVVISMGVGKAKEDKKVMAGVTADLARIAGQRPVVRKAKKSVSNFKLREGMDIGCMVTLRGKRMYEFVDRLINVAIPRMRDFRGLNPDSFDGRGNYTIGIGEQSIFPEIDIDKVEFVQGMNITLVTTGRNDAEARQLLSLLGMPFRRTEAQVA
jgi:large subunit ribosomal protein L5